MKTCAVCGKESDDLSHPPPRRYGPPSYDLLCEECLQPCICKGGYMANCTCDAGYEQEREKRWGFVKVYRFLERAPVMTSLMRPYCDLIMYINGRGWKVVSFTSSGAASCGTTLLHEAEFIMTPSGEVLKDRYGFKGIADRKREGLEFYHRHGSKSSAKESGRKGGGFKFL